MTQQDKKIFLPIIGIVTVLFIIAGLSIKSGNKYNKMVDKSKEYELSKVETQQKITDSIQKVQDSLKVVESYKDSILIIKSYTSEPNSAGGVDLNIIWKNKSKRVVKYTRFKVSAINAVNDEVYSDIDYDNLPTYVKVTGPIKPNQVNGYGTYWDCVWYNSTIKRCIIRSVELEYMDGSKLEIKM